MSRLEKRQQAITVQIEPGVRRHVTSTKSSSFTFATENRENILKKRLVVDRKYTKTVVCERRAKEMTR